MDECNHYWLPIYYPATPVQEQRFCLDGRPYARCTMCGATKPPQAMTPVTRRYWVYVAVFASFWAGMYVEWCLVELHMVMTR
jgi:hypothetical protein